MRFRATNFRDRFGLTIHLGVSAAFLMVAARTAFAHGPSVERQLYLESVGPDRLDMAVHLVVRGTRPILLLADTNRDRIISAAEWTQVKGQMVSWALDGLRLVAGTDLLAFELKDVEITPASDRRPVEVMVHGTARLPSGALRLFLANDRTAPPVELRLLGGSRSLQIPGTGQGGRGAPMPSPRVLTGGGRVLIDVGPFALASPTP